MTGFYWLDALLWVVILASLGAGVNYTIHRVRGMGRRQG